MQTISTERHRFSTLDSWRGVAALFVCLLHFYVAWSLVDFPIFRNASLFVDFFFVLSGFVVTHAYLQRLQDQESVCAFAIRRFGRLWPNHVVVLALFIVFQFAALLAQRFGGISLHQDPFTGSYDPGAIVTNLLLLQPLGMHDELTWNRPSWSIAVEFWTYLVFAAVVVLSARKIVAASVVIILVSLIVVAAFSETYMVVGNKFGLFRCIAGFFSGSLTYLFFVRQPQLRPSGTLAEILVIALAGAFVWFGGPTPLSLLAPFVFSSVIVVFASEGGMVSKGMKTAPLLFLGRVSFAIYIVHSFVHLIIFQAVRLVAPRLSLAEIVPGREIGVGESGDFVRFFNPIFGDILAVAYVLMVVVAAFLLRTFVEEPAQKWFVALANRIGSARISMPASEEPKRP